MLSFDINNSIKIVDIHKIIMQNIDTRAEMLFTVLYYIQYYDKCRQTFYKSTFIGAFLYMLKVRNPIIWDGVYSYYWISKKNAPINIIRALLLYLIIFFVINNV